MTPAQNLPPPRTRPPSSLRAGKLDNRSAEAGHRYNIVVAPTAARTGPAAIHGPQEASSTGLREGGGGPASRGRFDRSCLSRAWGGTLLSFLNLYPPAFFFLSKKKKRVPLPSLFPLPATKNLRPSPPVSCRPRRFYEIKKEAGHRGGMGVVYASPHTGSWAGKRSGPFKVMGAAESSNCPGSPSGSKFQSAKNAGPLLEAPAPEQIRSCRLFLRRPASSGYSIFPLRMEYVDGASTPGEAGSKA